MAARRPRETQAGRWGRAGPGSKVLGKEQAQACVPPWGDEEGPGIHALGGTMPSSSGKWGFRLAIPLPLDLPGAPPTPALAPTHC